MEYVENCLPEWRREVREYNETPGREKQEVRGATGVLVCKVSFYA